MACTITSLIVVAMFGVIAAAGLVERASLKGSSPARQDGSPARIARTNRRDPGAFQVFGGHACRRGRPALDQWRLLLAS
jgi:hypothetical protein